MKILRIIDISTSNNFDGEDFLAESMLDLEEDRW